MVLMCFLYLTRVWPTPKQSETDLKPQHLEWGRQEEQEKKVCHLRAHSKFEASLDTGGVVIKDQDRKERREERS